MTESLVAAREARAVSGKDAWSVACSARERPRTPPGAARGREEEVLVLDFGGQYSQLIARRIRECGVFAELLPHDTPLEAIRERRPAALVLSGGPASVYSEGAPRLRTELLDLGPPVLGICYGMQ